MHAALQLARAEPPSSKTAGQRSLAAAIRATAARLGNTPAICRKSYVHPQIIDGYLDASLSTALSEIASIVF